MKNSPKKKWKFKPKPHFYDKKQNVNMRTENFNIKKVELCGRIDAQVVIEERVSWDHSSSDKRKVDLLCTNMKIILTSETPLKFLEA